MKKRLLLMAGLAAAYVVSGALGMLVASPPGNVTSVWFPAGISLAMLIKFGDRVWPGITVGAFITNLLFFPQTESTVAMVVGALVIAAGSTFGNRLALHLLLRTCGVEALARPGTVVTLTACVLAGSAVNATVGLLATLPLTGLEVVAAPSFWLTWLLGDAVGMLLIAPFVLSEGTPAPRRPWEFAGAIALTLLVAQVIFARPVVGWLGTSLPMAWAVLPPVVWAGARLGARRTLVITLTLYALITWSTLEGVGPLGGYLRPVALLMVDGLLVMLVMTFMLLVSSIAAVRGERALLEARVRERTQRLEAAHQALVGEAEERVRLTAKLVGAQKQDALGRLAGGVAHDFNNLLTVISGEAHLLLLGGPMTPEVHDGAEAILAATHRAAELTRQLLTVARRQPTAPLAVELAVQLNESRRLLRPLFPESVLLELDTRPGCVVLIDPTQLDQLLLNLALNARDASGDGGKVRIANFERTLDGAEAARVGVAAGRWAVLELSDSGVGIAPEVLPRIFEPFFTTKGGERGTGLGLSTVWGIATQAGGTVRVESTVGVGTKFEVWLPRVDQRPTEATPPAPSPEGAPPSATLLVVEDESLVRRTVTLTLERAGYRVLIASDGEEALSVARQNPAIDLVLTDVVMPRMGGVELARHLRASRQVPVIFMSGFHDRQADLADEEVLSKPFAPGVLLARVNAMLRRSGHGAVEPRQPTR